MTTQRAKIHPLFALATRISFLIIVFSITNCFASTQPLSLLPQPTQVKLGSGQMPLRDGFIVRYSGMQDPRIEHTVARLYDRLSRKLGFVVMQEPAMSETPLALTIECDKKDGKVQTVQDDESYSLAVTAEGATLHAAEPLGVLRGLETFYQLAENTPDGFGAVPAVNIQDQPRFKWRGLLLDVARHYMPLEQIEREIDGMAAVKMNVLHLHLSDDQSFRVESKKFPQLVEKSSHGQFYTQAQIKELVAYARDRGVRILPEFDVPGHSTAWLAAFPELAVTPPDPNEKFIHFGGYRDTLDPSNPKLMKVLDKLFGEMATLFPDEYFHIGGDEVVYRYWKDSPAIKAFMQKHNLADYQSVQAYFNKDLEKILHKHGKKMIGWNEILHADLPTTTIIHSWTGVQPLEEAVQRGYSVVVSLGYYLDWYMPASFYYEVDPLRPTAQHYDDLMNAIPGGPKLKGLQREKERALAFKASPEAERLVLGGEAAEWTELTTPWSIDSEIWPRLGAIAERFWSPADTQDVHSLYRRLDVLTLELADLGINPAEDRRQLRLRLAGSERGAQAIATFAEAVEPTRYYTRNVRENRSGIYNINSPVNRLVDCIAPESATARRFHEAVAGWLASKDQRDLAFLTFTLRRWRANDQAFSQLANHNPRLAEASDLVDSLRGYVNAASDALGYLQRGESAPAWWVQAQQAVLSAPGSQKSDLQLAIASDVRKLVDAAAQVNVQTAKKTQ